MQPGGHSSPWVCSAPLWSELVMLTQSVSRRLAGLRLPQMGFMAVECGLGLYELADAAPDGSLHLQGARFLMAGGAVNVSRVRELRQEASSYSTWSLICAPLSKLGRIVRSTDALGNAGASWPWWRSAVLALAWAPSFG